MESFVIIGIIIVNRKLPRAVVILFKNAVSCPICRWERDVTCCQEHGSLRIPVAKYRRQRLVKAAWLHQGQGNF